MPDALILFGQPGQGSFRLCLADGEEITIRRSPPQGRSAVHAAALHHGHALPAGLTQPGHGPQKRGQGRVRPGQLCGPIDLQHRIRPSRVDQDQIPRPPLSRQFRHRPPVIVRPVERICPKFSQPPAAHRQQNDHPHPAQPDPPIHQPRNPRRQDQQQGRRIRERIAYMIERRGQKGEGKDQGEGEEGVKSN